MFAIPEKVLALARAVNEAGGRALLVGGCVRDPLMGREPKDWDLEVYGLEPERLRALLDGFGPVNVVGEAFTVYKLGHDLDISIPRRERKSGRGHRAFVIEGDPSMTIEDATRRRDFTINAILQDPLTDEIIDPFGGQADIQKKGFCALFRRIPLPKTVCACCAPRSLPRGLSLRSKLKPSRFAARSICPICRRKEFGARWKSFSCARNTLRLACSACASWAQSISSFPKSKR